MADPIIDRLGKFVVLAPVAHLLACAIYLSGYIGGFAGGISSYLSISDVFSVSLANLAFTYVTAIVIPSIYVWFLLHPPLKKMEDGSLIQPEVTVGSFPSRFLVGFMIALVLGIGFVSFNDRPVPYGSLLIAALFLLQPEFFKAFEKRGLDGRKIVVLWCLAVFVSTAYGSGRSAGEAERRFNYITFGDKKPSCGTTLILRRMGDLYLGARPDNRRVIINQDCEQKFIFAEKATFSSAPWSVFGLFEIPPAAPTGRDAASPRLGNAR